MPGREPFSAKTKAATTIPAAVTSMVDTSADVLFMPQE